MKSMSRLPPTETDEATAATLDLGDGDGDGDGTGVGGGAREPRKHGPRWKAQIEINNIPSSLV